MRAKEAMATTAIATISWIELTAIAPFALRSKTAGALVGAEPAAARLAEPSRDRPTFGSLRITILRYPQNL